jgi:hypothetical protein
MKLREHLARRLGMPVRLPAGEARGHDLQVMLDGASLRVYSERTSLTLSAEALGSAFLLPAASMGRAIAGDSVDAAWLAGAQRILDLAHTWWGWPVRSPRFTPRSGEIPALAPTGLAFSLGVDSFYSCFFADPQPDLLILAGGYDVPFERLDVLARMQDSVAEVAAATCKDWTMIATNLRQHGLYRRTSWDVTHGGALAFLGHLLNEHIGTLLISASFEENHLGPWGSHPDLDPLWSSSRVRVRHIGQEVTRSEKFRRLMRHAVAAPLVRRHLRVCWEFPSDKGNCGRCHKCVMTRISLHRDMPGIQLETMPETVPLAEAIESLPPITNNLTLNFRRELLGCPDPRVEKALRDLIRRSEESISSGSGR